jgi:hypothetical protein
MKKWFFIIFVIAGLCGMHHWANLNQKEIEKEKAEIMKDIATEEMKKAFNKVSSLGEKSDSVLDIVDNPAGSIQQVPSLKKLVVSQYDWILISELPGNEKMKRVTIALMNAFKSSDDTKIPVDFFLSKEVKEAIEEFDKNPEQARVVFEYILAQPEVKDIDGMSANIFKMAGYVNFEKKEVVNLAVEVVNNYVLDQRAIKFDEQENENQILKICEASKLIIENKADDKEGVLRYMEGALSVQKNPIVRTEIINQLRVYYPDEAEKFDKRAKEIGEEGFHEFFANSNLR